MRLKDALLVELYQLDATNADHVGRFYEGYTNPLDFVRRFSNITWEVFLDGAWYVVENQELIPSLEKLRELSRSQMV